MMAEYSYDGIRVTCPDCGNHILIEWETARCPECGWMAADAELDEILNMVRQEAEWA